MNVRVRDESSTRGHGPMPKTNIDRARTTEARIECPSEPTVSRGKRAPQTAPSRLFRKARLVVSRGECRNRGVSESIRSWRANSFGPVTATLARTRDVASSHSRNSVRRCARSIEKGRFERERTSIPKNRNLGVRIAVALDRDRWSRTGRGQRISAPLNRPLLRHRTPFTCLWRIGSGTSAPMAAEVANEKEGTSDENDVIWPGGG
jgi:hypothetical protein